jgi:RNA polymerase sigma factor (sigma-70 family)
MRSSNASVGPCDDAFRDCGKGRVRFVLRAGDLRLARSLRRQNGRATPDQSRRSSHHFATLGGPLTFRPARRPFSSVYCYKPNARLRSLLMDASPLRESLDRVRQAALPPKDDASDDCLLEAFVRRGDADAFAVLVRRYGRLVLGVCRRVLADRHDAEDAFQATFLVLVKKAESIRKRRSLASWLHRVASRTALDAQVARARRRVHEVPMTASAEPSATEPLPNADVQAVLDQELDGLPEKYREAVVLCDLEGRTRREAVGLLGVADGTLSGRLTTAHRLLARRLSARGVTCPVVALSAALAAAGADAAEAPPVLLAATARSTAALSAGANGEIPSPILCLTQGVLDAMWMRKLKITALASVTATLIVLGAGISLGPVLLARPSEENSPNSFNARLPDQKLDPKFAGSERREVRVLGGHESTVYVAFGKGGRLATYSGKSVRLWDAATGKEIDRLLGHIAPIASGAFSPDGRTIATTDAMSVRFWDAETGKQLSAHGGALAGVEKLAFSPDGKTLACVAGRAEVRLWELRGERVMRTFNAEHPKDTPVVGLGVAFSPDGKHLAQVYTDGHPGPSYLRLWEVSEGKLARTLIDGVKFDLWGVTFSPDGKLLAAGDMNGLVRLFDTTRWEKVGEHDARDQLRSLAFAPDSRTLALGLRRDVQIWDAATGKRLRTLAGHGNWVLSLAFSPDGETLASGSSDKTARLWPLE